MPVVNINSLPSDWQLREEFDEHIYIGRPNSRVRGPYLWSNPYKVGERYPELNHAATYADVCTLYDWHILGLMQSLEFNISLYNLHEKTLVCWCKSYTKSNGEVVEDKPCHGEVLLYRAAEIHQLEKRIKNVKQWMQDVSEAGEIRAARRLEYDSKIHALLERNKISPPAMHSISDIRAAMRPVFKLANERDKL